MATQNEDLLEEEQEGGLEPIGGRPDPEAKELADNPPERKKQAA